MHQLWIYSAQWSWVEERAKTVGISASALVRALIDTAMDVDIMNPVTNNHNNKREKHRKMYSKITKPEMAWEGGQNDNPNLPGRNASWPPKRVVGPRDSGEDER